MSLTKLVSSLPCLLLMVVTTSGVMANNDCTGTDVDNCSEKSISPGENALPVDANATVKELHAQMRYFMGVGMASQSRKKRDEIVAVYQQHNVPVPDVYKKWLNSE